MLPRRGHHTDNKRKPQMEEVLNFNQFLSYKPHSNFKPTWIFFGDFVRVLQMILLTKISMLLLGLHSKDRTSIKHKANTSNPKINRGCPPLTANHTCVQISLGPSIQYMRLGVYRTGGFNAMCSMTVQTYDTRGKRKLFVKKTTPGPPVTKRTDVLPQDLVKFRSREIRV